MRGGEKSHFLSRLLTLPLTLQVGLYSLNFVSCKEGEGQVDACVHWPERNLRKPIKI